MKNIVKVVAAWISGIAVGAVIVKKIFAKAIIAKDNESEKFQVFFHMLNRWLLLKQQNKNIADYLLKNNYKKVAIYGMGQLGETLFHELVYSGVEVVFGIDRNKDHLDCDIDIYSLEEKLPHADVIIVTAVTYYSEVVWFLSRKVECPIESLENIIVELGREEGIAV